MSLTPVSWTVVQVGLIASWASENVVVTDTPVTGFHVLSDLIDHELAPVSGFFPNAVEGRAIKGWSVFVHLFFFPVVVT